MPNLTKIIKMDISFCGTISFDINKFTSLTNLNINSNTFIKNITNLTTLTTLNAGGYSGIRQNSLDVLINLKKLNIDYKNDITSISHLTNLTFLNANGNFCSIKQNSLDSLTNLTFLSIDYNSYIKPINNLTNLNNLSLHSNVLINDTRNLTKLIVLKVSGYSIIDQNNIRLLTDLNIAGPRCKIDQADIMNLYSLRAIKTIYNDKIISIIHLQI